VQRLKNKTAIVTGAGRGIGAAIARRLSLEGASVVIAEIDPSEGLKTAKRIEKETTNPVLFIPTDVSRPHSVQAMEEQTRLAFGTADILVNNAGVAVFREPLASTKQDWDRCMSVDIEGVWSCCRAVLPAMLEKRDGAIINIISNHAFSIIKSTFPYPVAKHALLGLTRSLALEYADRGISINAISPGYTDTQIAENEFARAENPAQARAETEAKQPPGRLCRPDEIAAIAAMLASEEARFMIGENIVIDGGVSLRMYE